MVIFIATFVTGKVIQSFGAAGLRTLACAYRTIDPDIYGRWHQQYAAAKASIEDREEKIMDVGKQSQYITSIGPKDTI